MHDPGANEWGKSLRPVPAGSESSEQDRLCLYCHPIHGTAPKLDSQISNSESSPGEPSDGEGRQVGTGEDNEATRKADGSPASVSLCEACHNPAGPGTAVETPHAGKTLPRTAEGKNLGMEEGKNGTGAHDRPRPSRLSTFLPSQLLAFGRSSDAASPDTRIRCPTCHDIHQTRENSKLLRAARSDSTLCLVCHWDFGRILDTSHDLSKSAPQVRNVRGEAASESGPCGSCHLMHPPSAVSVDPDFEFQVPKLAAAGGTWAQRLPAEDKYGKGLCTCCHGPGRCAEQRVPKYADHPEVALFNRIVPGPAPTEPGSAGFGQDQAEIIPTFDDRGRLSPTGTISCPTCHQVHGVPSGPSAEDPAIAHPRASLRTSHQTLCADCHGAQALWRFPYYHKAQRNPQRQRSTNAPAVDAGKENNRP